MAETFDPYLLVIDQSGRWLYEWAESDGHFHCMVQSIDCYASL